jgi:ParB family transcriptional regulator, chromosome partitioning protein
MDQSYLLGFFEEVSINRIAPARHPLRREIGTIDRLMSSIERNGLLQPIIVRPRGDTFEVVAGNRRLAACKALKIKKVPCLVVELDDRRAYEASLVENLQRRTLDAIDEAGAYKKYVDDYGYGGISQLARAIGKSQPYVSRRLSILKLPEEIKEELMRGRINPSIAQELLSLHERQITHVTELIVRGGFTRSEVRRIVKDLTSDHTDVASENSHYSKQERRMLAVERLLAKCIGQLKVSLMRFDDIIDVLEQDDDDWLIREILLSYRMEIHGQIDRLLNLKKKSRLEPRLLLNELRRNGPAGC